MKALLAVGNKLLAQSADQGALPQLYAATAPERRGRRVHRPRRVHGGARTRRPWSTRSAVPATSETGSPALGGLRGAHRRLLPFGVALGRRSTSTRRLGRVGLPAPVAELAAREWDAIVVGGGHNGLTAAAYLARAGKRVLVCERREQLGGAATLERPFADQRFVVSPCAYLVGLLDQVVIDELELERHGYRVTPADPNLWCPVCRRHLLRRLHRRGAHRRVPARPGVRRGPRSQGLARFGAVFDRIRDLLRAGAQDLWQHPSPGRAEVERLLGDDPELIGIVFEESIASMLDRYVCDQRLQDAIACQGTIGTFAGPRDPGTASIRLMHHQGDLLGLGSVWGYVDGGLGRVSFAIAQAALEAGATIAAGVPVAGDPPG